MSEVDAGHLFLTIIQFHSARHLISQVQIAALSETRFEDVGGDQRSWCGIHLLLEWTQRVKRGVKQELASPLKQNLLVGFQDCQKASMTA